MRAPRILVVDTTGDLPEQVRDVTVALRPRAEVVTRSAVSELPAAAAEHGPFDVVLVGPGVTTAAGLDELRRFRRHIPLSSLVVAVDRFQASSLRATIRTGAVDIFRFPVEDDVLLETIEQALEVRGAVAALHPEEAEKHARRGRVVAVVSATGGCGKTFFSTNLAFLLQNRMNRRTCVIDLDLQFGELSTALRLKPKLTIADLADADSDAGVGVRMEEALVTHGTGFQILAAPEEPALADGIDAEQVSKVIEAARARFDEVVIDTPAALNDAVLAALEHADEIFAVATLDLPSVRNLSALLTIFKQLKVPAEPVRLVLNKVEQDVGIEVDAVTKYFPQGFSMVVPYGREVNRSLNMGMPMLAYAPRSEVSRVLEAGLERVLPRDDEPVVEPPPVATRPGLFAGLRRKTA
jgi:pilus assembly protein CpaE